jgi:phosphate butyryltransferase
MAIKAGLADVTLVGDPEEIKKSCEAEGVDMSQYTIIAESEDVKAVEIAVKAVHNGEYDVLMKGVVPTDKYMRGILNKECGLMKGPKSVLSHVSVMEWSGYHKLLTVSDIAVIPQPDIKQKQQLIGYLRSTCETLGIKTPKIGCIAPSEQVLTGSVSSTESAVLAKMADRGQLGDVIVDGPLSLDVALYREVAEHKHVKGSAVAGDVDALLFPNIESGNVFFKSASHFGGSELAAMVVGTKYPCVLTSRGDTPLTKKYSIALACLAAR